MSFNYSKWVNADYDAKMKAASETTDLAERANLLAEAEKIYLAEVPSIPILYYSSRALVSDKVAGYEDNILDNHFSRWLSITQ